MTQYITHMTLTEVSEAISKKKLSSLEVTEACLKRMEELSDKLQSTAEINFDFARAQAKKADEDFKNGIILSALHGIPLAHKDMYYRSGRISGWRIFN